MSNRCRAFSGILIAVLGTAVVPGPPSAFAQQCDPVEIHKILAADGAAGDLFSLLIHVDATTTIAGTTLGLNQTTQLAPVVRAHANGVATLDVNVPNAACNRIHLQAIDLSNCATSNVALIK